MATDVNGVILGPIPPGVPHLKIPFSIDSNGLVATVEQDSSTEIVQCVAMLAGTRRGDRLMVPTYGITDPTFAGLNQVELQTSVTKWEPRATITVKVTEGGDEQVHVGVKGGSS